MRTNRNSDGGTEHLNRHMMGAGTLSLYTPGQVAVPDNFFPMRGTGDTEEAVCVERDYEGPR
eukprot:CAMPEP_0175924716 /NCGR_PEP_ID=MMETSP0108-20121206/15262_1 /TAXON_ID=195067 ORGANISM="Goniomonas pacifica, Strain CCMP1869" /NCGR_SAMPLE_ID=MMETSP0108 /ASSEMBLY_ACC=CAM_ASM_000204 /LENGTH=61 /DNA_ID=CAMNT_0017247821 /DNA_START=165 /DNA_END=347 /DNA_ORIENTATION=-